MAAEQLNPGMTGDAVEFISSILQACTEYSIIGLNLDGAIVLWNEGARRLYGYENDEVIGKASSILHTPDEAEGKKPEDILARALKNAKWEGTVGQRRKGGEHFFARVIVTPRRDATGTTTGFLMVSTNISAEIRLARELQAELEARAVAQAALHESDERYRIVTQTATDAIISIDEEGLIVFVNAAAERIFGYPIDEMRGQALTMLMPECLRHIRRAPEEPHPIYEENQVLSIGVELLGRHKDGHAVALEVSFGEYHRDGKHLFTVVIRDITERKRAEARIHYLAHHDALTGLPNRVLFRDRVSQSIARARRQLERVAVLFLDLDGFKNINDSLGHNVGDELLRMTAMRLRSCLREGDSVGRIGGDEFVISLPLRQDDRDALSIASKILDSLREPFVVDEHELHVSASIGISIFPSDGKDAEAVMRAADTAMYHAKEKGRNNYQFFTPSLNEVARRRLLIANRLHQALARDEFVLVYQPQVDLDSGKIFAVEALLRWYPRDAGLMLPSEFIRVAEETGLIGSIGEWVLRQACAQLKQWREAGYADLRVAVNLSPEQFRRASFCDLVSGVLHETGLPAVALDLEITEGILMMQNPANIEILRRLAGTGIQLAVDDFGTGYSNLAYLQRFPIDAIKIDRSFVHGVAQDVSNSEIVSAIIAMAKRLKLHVVAEGVETADQAAFLREHGCRAAQGNFYYAPVSAQQLGELLQHDTSSVW